MVKKYAFESQEQAYTLLNATPAHGHFLSVPNAENAVDLGHITKVVGGTDEEPIIETSPLYSVDVMWFGDAPTELAQYEIEPNNPLHNFAV
jgi:hypothetical protein